MKDISAPRRASSAPPRKFDAVDRSNIVRSISRYHGLTAPQQLILYFVFDRTVEWDKVDERISLSHFEHGVYGKDGTCWRSAVGFSLPVIKRTLRELRTMGLLLASGESGSANRYRLNISTLMAAPKRCMGNARPDDASRNSRRGFFEDTGFSEELMPSREPCAPPERVMNRAVDTPLVARHPVNILTPPSPPNFEGVGGEEIAPKEQERKEHEKKEQKICSASRTEPSGLSLEKIANTFDTSTIPKSAASFKKQISSVFEVAWNSAFPGTYIPPNPNTLIAMHSSMRKFPKEEQALDWLEWCVKNWTVLGSTRLSWMANYPIIPNVGLLIGKDSNKFFVEAWQARQLVQQIAALPAEEQAIHRLMHEKGLTYSVAREAFQKRDVTRQEAEANELRAQRLNMREEAMVRREQVTAKIHANVMDPQRMGKVEVPKRALKSEEQIAAELAAMEQYIPEPWRD